MLQRQFVIVQNKRQKYRCGCGACETALAPLSLREGARYSLEFAVEVAVSKYADHLPLDRQARSMRREGLQTDSQTLWDQIQALATKLEPSYEALRSSVLSSFVIHMDETTWRLMDRPGSTGWWVWNLSSRYGAYYRLSPSRGTEVATEILAGFSGVVVADGYEVYAKLVRKVPGITLAACWAHVCRKFVECETSYPEQSKQALDLIRELYRIERACAGSDEQALRHRLAERRARSQAIVDGLFKWAREQIVLKQSGIGRAIYYMIGQRAGLEVFLTDARVPLDNNLAERSLRGVVVGRKNHYGSRSERGTQVAAIFYTLIESAKLSGVEPKRYLLTAIENALRNPGTITLPRDLIDVEESTSSSG